MATFILEMRDGVSTERVELDAADLDEARDQVEGEIDTWVRGGDWGEDGGVIDTGWTLYQEQIVGHTVRFAVEGDGASSEGTITARADEDTDASYPGDGPSEIDLATWYDEGQTSGSEVIDGIEYRWRVLDGTRADIWEEVELDSGSHETSVEPDHAALISRACGGKWDSRQERSCGDDPEDHDWTSEGEGGCDSNPGVWSTGGTSMSFASHCRVCGLHRSEHTTGSQRNPGEHDTVEYTMPETWCAECQSEECSCDEE